MENAQAILLAPLLLEVLVLVSVAFAESPRTSLEAAAPMLVVLTMVVVGAASGQEEDGALNLVFVITGVLALLALWSLVTGVIAWSAVLSAVAPSQGLGSALPDSLPRIGIWFLHPNTTAAVLATGCSVVLVDALNKRSALRLLVAGIAGIGVVATGSRIGVLAAIGGGYMGVLLLRRRLTRYAGLAFAVLGIPVTYLLIRLANGYRPTWLFRDTVTDRFEVWSVSLGIWRSRPFLGHGPGAFPIHADAVAGPSGVPGTSGTVWAHAHNQFFQSLVEFGLVGTTMMVLLLGALLVVASKTSAWGSGHRGFSANKAATVTALVATFIVCFSDAPSASGSGLVIAALMLGSVGGFRLRGLPSGRSLSLGVLVIVAPLLVMVPMSSTASRVYERGLVAAYAGDWQAAHAAFVEAEDRDPLPVYALASASAEYRLGRTPTELWVSFADRPDSQAHDHINLALASQDPEVVDRSSRKALESGHDAAIRLQAAALIGELGDDSTAHRLYREVLTENPWLVDSPFWGSISVDPLEVLDEERGRCVVAESVVVLNWEIDALPEWIDSCDNSYVDLLADIHGGVEGAGDLARSALAASPDSQWSQRAMGLYETGRGRLEIGRRHLVQAALLGDAPATYLLLETYDDQEVPLDLIPLVRENLHGYSPVIIAPSGVTFANRTSRLLAKTHQRPATPLVLLPGEWETAVTSLHLRLRESLWALQN